MINSNRIALALCGVAAVTLMSGCVVGGYGGVAVEAPTPAATVVMYPDHYVWDGYEYIGIIGSHYYYWGPHRLWIPCEPFRVQRFHQWERHHPDWQRHATRNEDFGPPNRGNEHFRSPNRGNERDRGRNYDRSRDRDHRDNH